MGGGRICDSAQVLCSIMILVISVCAVVASREHCVSVVAGRWPGIYIHAYRFGR